MAITVQQQPAFVSPVYNDLIYLVSSDNYAQTDFRFVCEVKTVGGTTLAKLKAPILNGATSQGVFNIHRILESYLTYDFDLDNDCTYFNTDNSIFKGVCNFGEDYAASGEVLGLTNVSGWVWNGAMTRRDFSNYVSGDWIVDDDDNNQFLTSQRAKTLRSGQWDWLYFLSLESPLASYTYYAKYLSYSATGTLLKTVELEHVSGSGGDYFMNKIPSGDNANLTASTFKTGSAPVIHASAAYYTIQLFSESDTAISELYRIDLDTDCTRHTAYHLYFLNPLGGFDSFVFDLISRTTTDVSRKQMKRQNYELNGTTYEVNLNKHATANYDVQYKDTLVLNSNWLTDAESEWLKELIASPVVFLHNTSESFYTPVNISTPKWEVKQTANDELFNCQIEIVMDSERVQRG